MADEGDSPNPDDLKPHNESLPAESAAGSASDYADLLSGDLLGSLDAANLEESTAAAPAEQPAETPEPAAETGEGDEGLLTDLGQVEIPPAEPVAAAPAEEAKEEEHKEEKETKPREPSKARELALTIGIPILVLVIAWLCSMFFATKLSAFSTAIYLIALGFIPYGIWKGRQTNSVYTVILGCALAALLTGVFCLWMEIVRITAISGHARPSSGLPCHSSFSCHPPTPPPPLDRRASD